MYEITLKGGFSSCHNLYDEKGVFEPLHGHNFKVEVDLRRQELDSIGVVADFIVIKKELNAVLQQVDMAYLNKLPGLDGKNSSVENVARWIHDELSRRIKDKGVRIRRVTVWETEDAGASYFPDEAS